MKRQVIPLLSIPCWVAIAGLSPAFKPKTKSDWLHATVRISIVDSGGVPFFGSGFFLNEGDSTYLYTNAHVIDRAERIEILDHSGARVTDIEWIEAFAEPFGSSGPNFDSAGDGVRMKLKNKRLAAFTLASDWSILEVEREVVVFGDNYGGNDGRQQIEILEGEILRCEEGLLYYDCGTKGGSSGGAVVDVETMTVVALNTWGNNLPRDPYLRIFGFQEGRGLGFGVVLQNPKWQRFSVRDYLAQGKAIHRLQRNLEVMILLSYLVPTAHGIYIFPEEPFVGDMTVGEAIARHEKSPVLTKLLDLSARLEGNRSSNIKISNVDVYKAYLEALDRILNERDAIVPGLTPELLSYYHRDFLQKRYLDRASFDFSENLSKCRAWFKQKIGVGGTIPLNAWESLPPFGKQLSREIAEKLLGD